MFQWYSICKLNKTAFYLAVEKRNIEIIKLLLNNDKLDVNIPHIFNITKFMKFHFNDFNYIWKQTFKLDFKSNILIWSKNNYFNKI